MKARKCDRCGKFHDYYTPTEETGNANALRLMGATQATAKNAGWYDLCEDCMKELTSFLNTPPAPPEEPVEPPAEGGDTEPTEPTPGPEAPAEPPTEGEEGDGGGENS